MLTLNMSILYLYSVWTIWSHPSHLHFRCWLSAHVPWPSSRTDPGKFWNVWFTSKTNVHKSWETATLGLVVSGPSGFGQISECFRILFRKKNFDFVLWLERKAQIHASLARSVLSTRAPNQIPSSGTSLGVLRHPKSCAWPTRRSRKTFASGIYLSGCLQGIYHTKTYAKLTRRSRKLGAVGIWFAWM